MKSKFTIYSLLFFTLSYSQTNNSLDNIKNLVETYFRYDRESIYVQFNKNIYVTDENIAFKGYVLNKNKLLPDANTTNVRLAIYNDKNELIQNQLLYTTLGIFEGGIHLSQKFTSGKYYFHFYTNWMNNFIEDDSFVETIEIINRNEPYQIKSKEPNWESAKIEFFPESGKIVSDLTNKIGVKITDCNHKGIQMDGVKVLDSKSNEVAQFKTNEIGNGSFYLNPSPNEKYSIQLKTSKINRSQPLPQTEETGLIISYNNNLLNNILAVAIKTNTASASLYQNKKLTLLVHQNGNFIAKEFSFNTNETEKTIRFDKSNLNNGVNTIRVIDEDLNEITNRLVYIENNLKPEVAIEAKAIANDSLTLSVKTNTTKSNLSISLLPENNICTPHKSSIMGTMYLNKYLAQPEDDTYLYFNTDNKTRKTDLELLLLNQKENKYLWSNIKSNPPQITHPFTQGITIKGNIINNEKSNDKYKVSLMSIKSKEFTETSTDVNPNNQFTFENVFVRDSTVVLLQVMNEKNSIKNYKINARVIPVDLIPILKPQINSAVCPITKDNEIFNFSKLGLDKSVTNLDEVVIKTESNKTKLLHKDNNNMAIAYKISENEFGSLLEYIDRTNEYRTGFGTDGSVFIKNKASSMVRDKDATPTVYVDDMEIFDLNFIFNININEVDEIYIDKMGISETHPGGFGTIKVYLKPGAQNGIFKSKVATFIVTNGFAKSTPFVNAPFETSKEFGYFGTLAWFPKIEIEANKPMEIKALKANQNEIQILIEGFSDDGQLISEIKKIPVIGL